MYRRSQRAQISRSVTGKGGGRSLAYFRYPIRCLITSDKRHRTETECTLKMVRGSVSSGLPRRSNTRSLAKERMRLLGMPAYMSCADELGLKHTHWSGDCLPDRLYRSTLGPPQTGATQWQDSLDRRDRRGLDPCPTGRACRVDSVSLARIWRNRPVLLPSSLPGSLRP